MRAASTSRGRAELSVRLLGGICGLSRDSFGQTQSLVFSISSTSPRPAHSQRGGGEMSGAAAETRSRVGRGADVPEPADRGGVTARRGEWPPQKALVQLGGATVRIAVDGVRVAVAEVLWRQHVDRADFVAQIGS